MITPSQHPALHTSTLTSNTPEMSTSDLEMSQPCYSSSKQWLQFPIGSTASATAAGTASDEQWTCLECHKAWEEGDDQWIVCDNCAKQYHLQCSGIQYATNQFYSLNIQEMNFFCDDCMELEE